MRAILLVFPMLLTGCQQPNTSPQAMTSPAPRNGPAPAPALDRGSVAAAVQVARHYTDALVAGDNAGAYRLWGDDGAASGKSEAAFATAWAGRTALAAKLGAPGASEGAAGSVYVEIPLAISGRLNSGAPFRMEGPLTLRRVNDVPGASAAQLHWHIVASGIEPR